MIKFLNGVVGAVTGKRKQTDLDNDVFGVIREQPTLSSNIQDASKRVRIADQPEVKQFSITVQPSAHVPLEQTQDSKVRSLSAQQMNAEFLKWLRTVCIKYIKAQAAFQQDAINARLEPYMELRRFMVDRKFRSDTTIETVLAALQNSSDHDILYQKLDEEWSLYKHECYTRARVIFDQQEHLRPGYPGLFFRRIAFPRAFKVDNWTQHGCGEGMYEKHALPIMLYMTECFQMEEEKQIRVYTSKDVKSLKDMQSISESYVNEARLLMQASESQNAYSVPMTDTGEEIISPAIACVRDTEKSIGVLESLLDSITRRFSDIEVYTTRRVELECAYSVLRSHVWLAVTAASDQLDVGIHQLMKMDPCLLTIQTYDNKVCDSVIKELTILINIFKDNRQPVDHRTAINILTEQMKKTEVEDVPSMDNPVYTHDAYMMAMKSYNKAWFLCKFIEQLQSCCKTYGANTQQAYSVLQKQTTAHWCSAVAHGDTRGYPDAVPLRPLLLETCASTKIAQQQIDIHEAQLQVDAKNTLDKQEFKATGQPSYTAENAYLKRTAFLTAFYTHDAVCITAEICKSLLGHITVRASDLVDDRNKLQEVLIQQLNDAIQMLPTEKGARMRRKKGHSCGIYKYEALESKLIKDTTNINGMRNQANAYLYKAAGVVKCMTKCIQDVQLRVLYTIETELKREHTARWSSVPERSHDALLSAVKLTRDDTQPMCTDLRSWFDQNVFKLHEQVGVFNGLLPDIAHQHKTEIKQLETMITSSLSGAIHSTADVIEMYMCVLKMHKLILKHKAYVASYQFVPLPAASQPHVIDLIGAD